MHNRYNQKPNTTCLVANTTKQRSNITNRSSNPSGLGANCTRLSPDPFNRRSDTSCLGAKRSNRFSNPFNRFSNRFGLGSNRPDLFANPLGLRTNRYNLGSDQLYLKKCLRLMFCNFLFTAKSGSRDRFAKLSPQKVTKKGLTARTRSGYACTQLSRRRSLER